MHFINSNWLNWESADKSLGLTSESISFHMCLLLLLVSSGIFPHFVFGHVSAFLGSSLLLRSLIASVCVTVWQYHIFFLSLGCGGREMVNFIL